jgi:hypothetical protein
MNLNNPQAGKASVQRANGNAMRGGGRSCGKRPTKSTKSPMPANTKHERRSRRPRGDKVFWIPNWVGMSVMVRVQKRLTGRLSGAGFGGIERSEPNVSPRPLQRLVRWGLGRPATPAHPDKCYVCFLHHPCASSSGQVLPAKKTKLFVPGLGALLQPSLQHAVKRRLQQSTSIQILCQALYPSCFPPTGQAPTLRLRHAGPIMPDCKLRRDPGVACSRFVGHENVSHTWSFVSATHTTIFSAMKTTTITMSLQ